MGIASALTDQPCLWAAVHQAIRRRAECAGYDPEFGAQLGGHSRRAWFVTEAFRNGADESKVVIEQWMSEGERPNPRTVHRAGQAGHERHAGSFGGRQ